MQQNPIKRAAKTLMRSLIYRFPPVYLSSAGIHIWFSALEETEALDGEVVEVGCYLGATAAVSSAFLKEIGSHRQYTVVDTFSGFVDEQFDHDVKLGGAPWLKREFSGNTPELARWVMDKHGGRDVKMVVGDIATVGDDKLPAKISACLLDVDLAEPIYQGLKRLYPRLVPGGVIVVDDCQDYQTYQARSGYERFMREQGLPAEICYGKGIVRKAVDSARQGAAAGASEREPALTAEKGPWA
jgi:O-methyltransferase